MTDQPLTFSELAAFVNNVPRIPRRELRCHSSVVEALRAATGPVPVEAPPGYSVSLLQDLLSVPVCTDDEKFAWGEWRIEEDGRHVASGKIKPPPRFELPTFGSGSLL
jgi:hypothetical protein